MANKMNRNTGLFSKNNTYTKTSAKKMFDSTEDFTELIQHLQAQRAMVKAQAHRISVLINRTKDKHTKMLRYQQDEEFRQKLKERSQQAYQKKKGIKQSDAASSLSPE